MKIGVLGTGNVGKTIANALVHLGHNVMMGARSADNEKVVEWKHHVGPLGSIGSFKDVAQHTALIFNCTKGDASLAALQIAGPENFEEKILIDLANPLDFSAGFPPTLTIQNTSSLGEEIQKLLPKTKVIKTLNTTNCNIMVNPKSIAGIHDMFICGNDPIAKEHVIDILKSFGWESIIDLGDISNARGMEMLLPLWIRLYGNFKHANFNFHVVQ